MFNKLTAFPGLLDTPICWTTQEMALVVDVIEFLLKTSIYLFAGDGQPTDITNTQWKACLNVQNKAKCLDACTLICPLSPVYFRRGFAPGTFLVLDTLLALNSDSASRNLSSSKLAVSPRSARPFFKTCKHISQGKGVGNPTALYL